VPAIARCAASTFKEPSSQKREDQRRSDVRNGDYSFDPQ
jgi:hypothetical protein